MNWELILEIIAAVIAALQNCGRSTEEVCKLAKHPGLFHRAKVRHMAKTIVTSKVNHEFWKSNEESIIDDVWSYIGSMDQADIAYEMSRQQNRVLGEEPPF